MGNSSYDIVEDNCLENKVFNYDTGKTYLKSIQAASSMAGSIVFNSVCFTLFSSRATALCQINARKDRQNVHLTGKNGLSNVSYQTGARWSI